MLKHTGLFEAAFHERFQNNDIWLANNIAKSVSLLYSAQLNDAFNRLTMALIA